MDANDGAGQTEQSATSTVSSCLQGEHAFYPSLTQTTQRQHLTRHVMRANGFLCVPLCEQPLAEVGFCLCLRRKFMRCVCVKEDQHLIQSMLHKVMFK